MKKYSNEIKVGVFFIVCLIGLLYLTVSTGKFHIKKRGYNIYVVFDDVAGLGKDSPVMINGLEAGRVQGIEFTQEGETKIKLKLLLQPDVKIWDNSKVSIKTLGFMGEKYVHIASFKGKEFIKPQAQLLGKSPLDMEVLLGEAETLSKNINTLAEEAKKLAETLNMTVGENRQSLSRVISNAGEITERLDFTLRKNGKSLDQIIKNLEKISINFEEFSEDIKRRPWKLLFKTKEKN
ncbi:MAG: MCE family protein [Candidatus Omnitrophica bacterium]|nr:MCE family protein [Candidatus Omnitrophota bacterium]